MVKSIFLGFVFAAFLGSSNIFACEQNSLKWLTNRYMKEEQGRLMMGKPFLRKEELMPGQVFCRPKSTKNYSVEQLEKLGFVGICKKLTP